jgi:hypothetical protein
MEDDYYEEEMYCSNRCEDKEERKWNIYKKEGYKELILVFLWLFVVLCEVFGRILLFYLSVLSLLTLSLNIFYLI